MGAFWLSVLVALSVTVTVLYGGIAIAFLTGRRIAQHCPIARIRLFQLGAVFGTALITAAVVSEWLAAVAVLMLTLLFDLAIAGGRGVTSVIRTFWTR